MSIIICDDLKNIVYKYLTIYDFVILDLQIPTFYQKNSLKIDYEILKTFSEKNQVKIIEWFLNNTDLFNSKRK